MTLLHIVTKMQQQRRCNHGLQSNLTLLSAPSLSSRSRSKLGNELFLTSGSGWIVAITNAGRSRQHSFGSSDPVAVQLRVQNKHTRCDVGSAHEVRLMKKPDQSGATSGMRTGEQPLVKTEKISKEEKISEWQCAITATC